MELLLGFTSFAVGLIVTLAIAIRHKPIKNVIVSAFFLRLTAACFHYWVYPFPYGVNDALAFESKAWEWGSKGFIYAFSQFDPTRSYVYSWACSLLYSITGRSTLMLQGINVLGGTLIVFHGYLIAKELWGKKRAGTIAWIIAVFPFLVQISAVTHREVFIVYFFTLGILYIVKWEQQSSLSNLGIAFGCLLSSALIHGGIAAAVLGAGIFVFLSSTEVSLRRLFVGKIRIPAVITVGLMIVVAASAGVFLNESLSLSSVGELGDVDVGAVASMAVSRAQGGAAYLESMYPTNYFDIVWQTPIRVLYFLFSPFPWQISKVTHVFALADAMLHMVILLGIWHSKSQIIKRRGASITLFILAAVIVAFAVVTSNFGTAMRHRAKFVPLLASLWGVSIVQARLVLTRKNNDYS